MSPLAPPRVAALVVMLCFGTGSRSAAAGPPAPAPGLERPQPRELAPAPLRPGPVQRWTVERVVRAVEARHPRMAALAAQRGAPDARVLTARTSIPNPSLLSDNGAAEYTYRLGVTQTLERRVDVAAAQIGVHALDRIIP